MLLPAIKRGVIELSQSESRSLEVISHAVSDTVYKDLFGKSFEGQEDKS